MEKKVSVILLALLLVAGILSGCVPGADEDATKEDGSDEKSVSVNESGFPIVDEEITLSMVGPHIGRGEWKEREYFIEMENMTNIHFKFNTPPRADFETKKQLLLGSGDLPDVFYASDLTQQEQMEYGSSGFLLPLEDLIDKYAPNIKKMFEERPEVEKTVTTPDGHIYALPSVDDQPSFWHMWYNGDWLNNLGVEELPKTTGELYDLLVRFKTEDPNQNGEADEIPISNHNGLNELNDYLLTAFGVMGMGIGLYDGEVGYGPIKQGYKAYLEYMNKLWEEDLLDHETFSQTNQQKQAKGHENLVGVFADASPYFMLGEDPEDTSNPVFHPITSPLIDEPIVLESTGIGRGTFAITKENKNPEATMRWIDYSYSKEGADFLHNGKEGSYWEWEDEESKEIRVMKEPPEGFDSPEDYRSSISPDWGIGVPIRRFKQDEYSWKFEDPFGEWIREEDQQKLIPYQVPRYPSVYFEKDDLTQIERIERDLTTYVEEMRAAFVTGKKPLSEWDDYIETIEDMKIDELISIYKEGYEQYQSN